MKTILVTGDIVRDAHLYGGAKSDATSITDLGTVFEEKTGGAALTAELLVISGDALGKAWDKTDADWKKGNENRAKAKKEPLPRPEQHSEVRPASYFSCHPALSAPDFATKPPLNLCSYGVWTPHPAKKDTKDLVWRTDVGSHFGYGPAENRQSGFCYTPNKSNIAHPVGVTVIDDGGTLFRHEVCRGIWPDLSKDGGGLYVLKMSHPLCCGDLWPALKPILPRLTVIVSAADLRRADAQINARLSWERCVEDTIATLNRMPAARELLHAANLIVNFGSGGALWVSGAEPRTYRLFFDGERFGGDFSSQFEGTVYGFQSCLTAGIAHHLMLHQLALEEPSPKPGEKPSLLASHKEFAKAMYAGIAAGLNARRKLLILGHGPVNNKIPPGFPFYELGQVIANESTGYASVQISPDRFNASAASWTILAQSETVSDANDKTPLYGLAALTARYGPAETLSDVPALHKGNLFTVDRSEIESLRTIDAIITAYEKKKIQKKPLSIGVFGPPGAGKSFAVKILALAILGPKSPFIEFNLSQFKGPDELIGAFHRIRDEVLKGVTPVAFWDEFDSQKYKWLQYLLAPMQDGTFQEGQITHPIGKCIFIFAGGTSPCLEQFGVAEPVEPGEAELSEMKPEIREFRLRKFLEQRERFLDFKLLKGPDFVSRLHGFLNVLGPNPRDENDITWPVRRALLLRGILQLPDSKELSIDPGLLSALIGVPKYWHGARSFEKILDALVQGRIEGRLTRSALPPAPLLARDTDAGSFYNLMTHSDAFVNHPDLEDLAAAVNFNFLDNAKQSKILAESKANPELEWTIDPSVKKEYKDLPEDLKASNRAAARRIPEHLSLIGFMVERQAKSNDIAWEAPLNAAIEKHLDRLAKAEHVGWCAERVGSGWKFGKPRNPELKLHHALVPWAQLSPSDQDKDRSSVKSIPELLKTAKYKALPLNR